jgi:beta-lactamase class C
MLRRFRFVSLCLLALLPVVSKASAMPQTQAPAGVQAIVTETIAPVMRQYGIPGMAVGIIFDGHIYVCNYGIASRATGVPINADTLFEIGSISKTFNTAVATYAVDHGRLSLSAKVTKVLPALRGSAFDHVSLLNLGTYTAGGLPLQFPDEVNTLAQLTTYLKDWKPSYPAGTMRLYSNVSIGLFGVIAANSLHVDYAQFLQDQMFPALGLSHSFVTLPAGEAPNYAQGYTDDGTPIRMAPGLLVPEYVGVRTTAADLARYLAINMGMFPINPAWQIAITATHTGYDQLQAGGMIQDLGWEEYKLPVSLKALQSGNSYQIILDPNPVKPFTPPLPPSNEMLLNKTGSTNGFGAYVAYVPRHKIGIVLLANRNYPIPARIATAYAILSKLNADSFRE